MAFQKGHKLSVGNKGGGRKTKAEEFRAYIEAHKEEITNEAILNLAKIHIVNKLANNPALSDARDIALPIVLKNMKEVKDVNVLTPKPLLYAISNSNSDEEGLENEEKNQGDSGRNISVENNLNSGLLDSISSD